MRESRQLGELELGGLGATTIPFPPPRAVFETAKNSSRNKVVI